jgi:hypothetical protein
MLNKLDSDSLNIYSVLGVSEGEKFILFCIQINQGADFGTTVIFVFKMGRPSSKFLLYENIFNE